MTFTIEIPDWPLWVWITIASVAYFCVTVFTYRLLLGPVQIGRDKWGTKVCSRNYEAAIVGSIGWPLLLIGYIPYKLAAKLNPQEDKK